MARYHQKPIVVDAEQLTTETFGHLRRTTVGRGSDDPDTGYIQIATANGIIEVLMGDWIVTGAMGQRHVYKPSAFEESYKLVTEAVPA